MNELKETVERQLKQKSADAATLSLWKDICAKLEADGPEGVEAFLDEKVNAALRKAGFSEDDDE